MKLIYFYSPLYEYFHHHITSNLKDVFDLQGITIDNLPGKHGHTFTQGVTIKLDLIIKSIKENMGDYIIFSDATIFINSNKIPELKTFIESYAITNDLVLSLTNSIAFMLINCNDKTLTFFENALKDLIETSGWDQEVILKHLKFEHNLKLDIFDTSKIVCDYSLNETDRNTFLIYKSYIRHQYDIIYNFNTRLNILKQANLITDEEYLKNLK